MRRPATVAATIALLAWVAYAAVVEVYRCGWAFVHDPWSEPSRWRVRSAHVAELEAFVDRDVAPHLPDGARVAVSSGIEPEGERFFLYLWLAYLLPSHDLKFAAATDPGIDADYWIAYGERPDDPRFEPVAGSQDSSGVGVLYRISSGASPGP